MKKYIAIAVIAFIFAIVFFVIPTYAAGGNANLSTLGIKPNDFTGFKESKTEYNATVPNTTKEVEVYAKAKDSKAKITGTGKLKLQEGQNTAKIVVNAQDGTQKTYTINIKRLKTDEKTDISKKTNTDVATTETKLQDLSIDGCELEPAFSKDIHQYKVNFSGDLTKLNLEAKAENLNVQIIGNEDLEDGENIITILVSDEAEENSTTYQIIANKNVTTTTDFKDFLKDENVKFAIKIAGIIVGGIIILIILIVIISKLKKKNNSNNREHEEKNTNIEFEELVEELNQKEEKKKNNSRESKKSGKHSK